MKSGAMRARHSPMNHAHFSWCGRTTDMPDDAFDSFDAGLLHVLTRLHGVLGAQRARTR